MRAASGIASADAVCSCFIHKPTPTPAATAHTRATITRCGHTFRLFIKSPLKLVFTLNLARTVPTRTMFLNHHRITTLATDRDGLGTDLALSVLISAEGRNPYGKSVFEIV